MKQTLRFVSLILAIAAFSLYPVPPAGALDLLVSGTWTFPSGSGLWTSPKPTLESAPGSAALHVVNARGTDDPWRVEVRLQGPPLPEGITLWVRRSGSGQGSGWIRDGLAFQPVGESPLSFLSGTGDRMQVPLQLKITGITPRTPAGTVRASLLFSVVSLR